MYYLHEPVSRVRTRKRIKIERTANTLISVGADSEINEILTNRHAEEGRGRERYINGSNVTETFPQFGFGHIRVDLSCPRLN